VKSLSQAQHDTIQKHDSKNILLNTTLQITIFLGLVAVILFASLFSTYPPVHDFFHGARHALMIIPCH